MIIPSPFFPPALCRLLEQLPAGPPSLLFTQLLNLAFRPVICRGDLEPLYGKSIALQIEDTGLHLYFCVQPRGFVMQKAGDLPALAIRASLRDFVLLASRQEDPDTLFFKRRLVVEGDTELALVAKNLLDRIEPCDLHLPAPLRLVLGLSGPAVARQVQH